MDWVYAAMIVGALVAKGVLLVDYVNYSGALAPQIRRLLAGTSSLTGETNAEQTRLDGVAERVETLKMCLTDLRRQSLEMKDRLRAERERGRRLELAVFRKRLKSRGRLVTA